MIIHQRIALSLVMEVPRSDPVFEFRGLLFMDDSRGYLGLFTRSVQKKTFSTSSAVRVGEKECRRSIATFARKDLHRCQRTMTARTRLTPTAASHSRSNGASSTVIISSVISRRLTKCTVGQKKLHFLRNDIYAAPLMPPRRLLKWKTAEAGTAEATAELLVDCDCHKEELLSCRCRRRRAGRR